MAVFARGPVEVVYYKNGNVKYEKVRYNNQLICITSYYKNGQIKEKGHYKKGKRHGWFEDFSHDGVRKTTAFFQNDKKDGLWTFYDHAGSVKRYVFFDKNKIVDPNFYNVASENEFSD